MIKRLEIQTTIRRRKKPVVDTYSGADKVSGTEPDLESDDDTLENAHEVGLQLDEDYSHPEPLDIARDVNKAENAQWHKKPRSKRNR